MKKIYFILLILLTSSAHAAEVFKCQLKSGKTVYQSLPCDAAIKQETIEILEPDPRKVADEEAKLKAWKEDYAKREEIRIKAEKERQAEQDRKASVEALKKSADYQQQQAYEEKRQTEALERQNMQSPYLLQYPLPLYYPSYQSLPAYPSRIPHHHHHHDAKDKQPTDTQKTEGNDPKNHKSSDSDPNRSKILIRGK
jgi:Skp family chaperone for outer membrane proteins